MARTIKLFTNVHMGQSHRGLSLIAARGDAHLDRLGDGEIVMFLNTKMDKLKIMGAGGLVVGYLKMISGRRIDMQAIQHIPNTFGSNGELRYDQALRRSLEQRLSS
jgi:hypothetical protein